MNKNFEENIPKINIRLRNFNENDYNFLVDCINNGRIGGFFERTSLITVESLINYIKKKNNYKNLIIYENKSNNLIGYIDFEINKSKCIFLGIYILSAYRNQNLGNFCVRWIINFCKVNKIKEIKTSIYKDNINSIQLFTSNGFKKIKEFSESSDYSLKISNNYKKYRKINFDFKSLKGENEFFMHLTIAELISLDIRNKENVVLGMGSLYREYGDSNSDIDIAILTKNSKMIESFWYGEQQVMGYSIDLFVVNYNNSVLNWADEKKQAYEESIILKTTKWFNDKKFYSDLLLTKKDLIQGLLNSIYNIGWYGNQPKEWNENIRYGYRWSIQQDVWIKRGSNVGFEDNVINTIGYLTDLMYLLEKRRIPDKKWKRVLLPSLKNGSYYSKSINDIYKILFIQERKEDVIIILQDLISSLSYNLQKILNIRKDYYTEFAKNEECYNPNN